MRVAEEWWYVPALLVPCTCESLPGSDLESTSEVVGVSSLLGDHTRSVADPHIMVGDNFSICAHILSNLPRSRGSRRSVRSLWAPLFSTACGPAIYVYLIIQWACKLSFPFLDTALLYSARSTVSIGFSPLKRIKYVCLSRRPHSMSFSCVRIRVWLERYSWMHTTCIRWTCVVWILFPLQPTSLRTWNTQLEPRWLANPDRACSHLPHYFWSSNESLGHYESEDSHAHY